jgi:hypothetical protein
VKQGHAGLYEHTPNTMILLGKIGIPGSL